MSPFFFQIIQGKCCCILIRGVVNRFHVGSEFSSVCPTQILEPVAYLVYDADLHGSLRNNGTYGFGKPFEVVDVGNKYIINTTCF